MRAGSACLARQFRSAEHASAAVEFAVICPFLLILMMAGLQLISYIEATRRVERVAASIAQMMSQAAPPPSSTTATSTSTDIHFAYDSSLVLFPYVMKDAPRQNIGWWIDLEVDIASVMFQQTGPVCATPTNLSACYTAQVAWTATLGASGRQCGPLAPAPNTAPTARTTLPAATYGPGGLIVVDVYFTFHPTFASNLIAPITIKRSAYLKPRYANFIAMDFSSHDPIVTECPGY